jgi:aerobic-type carbon monoxide dehydrogenase small subunit (CoxS/CutS family)
MQLNINGVSRAVASPPLTSLLRVLREELDVLSPKHGCEQGGCGACTVLVDGEPVLSCITLVHAVEGAQVTTIEGLREHPMIDAFVRTDALQCGFCTPGQIVSAVALVDSKPTPTTEEIRHAMAGNLCRCGAYPKIEEAIRTWRD